MSQTRSPERLTIRLDASGANHAKTSMNNPNANTLRTRNALFIAHQPSSLSSFAAMPSAQIVQLYLKFGYVKPTVWLKTTSETISAGFLASRRLGKKSSPPSIPSPSQLPSFSWRLMTSLQRNAALNESVAWFLENYDTARTGM